MRHGKVTFDQVHAVLDRLNGETGIEAILADSEIRAVKFGSATLGQYEAFRNYLPEGAWEDVLAGRVKLVIEEPSKVVVRPKEQLKVDTDGRFIFRDIKQVGPPNWVYGFDRTVQPGYPEILEQSEYAFERKIGISAGQFEDKAEAKKREMLNDPRWALYANLFLGKHARPFAIALPQMVVPEKGGLGELLARTIIPVAKRGYGRPYPKRIFNDCLGDALIGQTETVPGSRQERLIEAFRQGPQVLWVFLNSLQGASFNAARALIQTLLEEFILGGTLVNAPVIAAYPVIAAASSKCPLYFCAADVFRRGDSLSLGPGDDGVSFAYWDDLGHCYGNYSASVAVLA